MRKSYWYREIFSNLLQHGYITWVKCYQGNTLPQSNLTHLLTGQLIRRATRCQTQQTLFLIATSSVNYAASCVTLTVTLTYQVSRFHFHFCCYFRRRCYISFHYCSDFPDRDEVCLQIHSCCVIYSATLY